MKNLDPAIGRILSLLLALVVLSPISFAKDRWLEIIEVYELPNDPAWPASARAAGSQVSGYVHNPGRMPFPETAARLGERMAKAGDNSRSREAVQMAVRNLAEKLVAGSNQLPRLKVIRAWDGYAHARVEFVCGPDQGNVVAASKPGARFLAITGNSNSPDHWQAAGRATILRVNRALDVPSDFVSLENLNPSLRDLAFGRLKIEPNAPKCIGNATKDPSPGGTQMSVAFKGAESGTPMDLSYPHYCEFKVFQRAQDGSREREVRFKGPKHAVSIGGPAIASVELLDKPSAFGYEVEAVAWYGVARRDALSSDGKRPLESPTEPQRDLPAPPSPDPPSRDSSP